jgi:putative flippase GtrA
MGYIINLWLVSMSRLLGVIIALGVMNVLWQWFRVMGRSGVSDEQVVATTVLAFVLLVVGYTAARHFLVWRPAA